jgi:signal transduction histidine kinase/DNA-binding response OmpR family regulator/ligand-binding sensor domain-containing protein
MIFSISPFRLLTRIITILCLVISSSVFGQFKYETLSTAQGLSQGYIWDIIQCKDGFLWMTTKAGLNRYDGYSFKVYSYDAFDPYSISSNNTLYLYEDSKGRIWVGSDHGLNVFDKKTEKFYRLYHDAKNSNSLSSNVADEQITELADGRFLVNTSHDAFDIVTLPDDFFKNEKAVKIEHINKPKNSFNAGNYYNEVTYTDSKNITWYKCDHNLYRFNEKTYEFELQKVGDLARNQIIKNQDGSVWFGDEYISLFDGINVYPTFTKPMFNGHTGYVLTEDNGRLWRSNNNLGFLDIFDISTWQKGQPLDPAKHIIASDKNVSTNKIFKDRSGLVWLGLNGHGLRKYSFEFEKFKHLAKTESIRKVQTDLQNNLYIQTWSGNYQIDTKGNLIHDERIHNVPQVNDKFISKTGNLWITKRMDGNSSTIVFLEQINLATKQNKIYPVDFKGIYTHEQHIMEDQSGRLWIGGLNGFYSVFDTKTGNFKEYNLNNSIVKKLSKDNYNTVLYNDNQGIVWMGTQEGFAKIESKNILTIDPKVTWYCNDPKNKTSLNNNNVSSFLDDPTDNGLLWIATKGGGLNLMEKSSGKIRHITVNQGLCDNTVYGILDDEKGNIWGSTNNGLFCILNSTDRKGNFEIRHFTEAAGLQAAEFNTDAYAKLLNGHLAFGGINGLNVFDPKEILIDTIVPNIFVTKLIMGNQVIIPNEESSILSQAIEFTPSITLKHYQDVFTLEFSSLDFRAPDQIKYRYQLEGIDENWLEIGKRRSVTYSHLPAGSYTFKVQGSNSLGIWNDKVKELTIKILPPWYASWYAYMLYAILLGLGIRAYYKYKLEQNRMATQLQFEQNENHRVKELDKVKTDLYTNITHEFRTPLTVILGMVQHIRRSASDHLDNGLDMIERNGNNLLRLVNEMLDLSKLEAGKMELNLVHGDVINFIRYIIESFHSVAESQDKKMHYLSSIDTMYVKYDEEKIRQIVSNLLSNALKFTSKKGDIYLSISQDNNNHLCIKVKDTGSGIPESQQHHIFDRFYQADSTHTRHAEGTGIGLALTKELVQLMNGQISVKSPPTGSKKGTEFTVILPLEIITDYVEETSIKEPAMIAKSHVDDKRHQRYIDFQNQTNPDKELILLVEDNADVVAYTASCLQDYRLAVSKDGQEGLDIARELIPDLIITDVMMPVMDGFEMTRNLRIDERTSHIPIIMLTAKADIDSKLEGIDYGAEVYLEKPFNVDELKLRVRKLLDQRMILQKAYASKLGVHTFVNEKTNKEEKTSYDDIVVPQLENEFVKKVTLEIEAHLSDESFSVEQLARSLFMSYSQVQRKLNALIGMSPNHFIRHLRLQKAKELLSTTDETILNISSDCGFSDPSYFAKVFKQEFGVGPQEWRNRS